MSSQSGQDEFWPLGLPGGRAAPKIVDLPQEKLDALLAAPQALLQCHPSTELVDVMLVGAVENCKRWWDLPQLGFLLKETHFG